MPKAHTDQQGQGRGPLDHATPGVGQAITPFGGALWPIGASVTSVAGFVQQLAVAYVAHGYWFYVIGRVPESKDPATVDRKIIHQYGIDVSKWARSRRKKTGQARVQYLRYDRFFGHRGHARRASLLRSGGESSSDIRRQPLHFMGYSIGCRKGRDGQKWHPSVRIAREMCRELKARAAIAVHRPVEELCRELRGLDYEPYAAA